jgi:succinate dehydrogenase / fumarate reductase iron-sulfur subunit
MHSLLLLLDLLPELLVEPGPLLGRSILLQSYRWIADSRDQRTGELLDRLEDPFRLYRRHSIMNCTKICPKGLNPARTISNTKRLMVERG